MSECHLVSTRTESFKICSCFSVSIGTKILSIIILAIWIIYTFDIFMESSHLMFGLSCVGCFYNLLLCFYVFITASQLRSYFMQHPMVVIIACILNILMCVVLTVLAYSSTPVWEQGGVVAHARVSSLTLQVLLATVSYAVALIFYYCNFGPGWVQGGSPFKQGNRQRVESCHMLIMNQVHGINNV